MLFVRKRPAESETAHLYNEGLLGVAPVFSKDSGVFPEWKRREHAELLDHLAQSGISGGSILDVGCFVGSFLEHARDRGFQVVGVEPSAAACRYTREVASITAIHGTLHSAAFPANHFSAVTLLDVLEHVPDPIEELREVHRILRPGGILIITTPDALGLPQRVVKTKRMLFRQNFCPIDEVPWHLWGFTHSSLRLCIERAGFGVREIWSLVPSLRSTNQHAGATAWKKVLLRILCDASQTLGMSDRMALVAEKREAESKRDSKTGELSPVS